MECFLLKRLDLNKWEVLLKPAKKLKIGQKVKVTTDFGKDDTKEYTGTLAWISSKSEFTPKTIQTRDERANLVYAVKINVRNNGLLKIGMYGEVSF